MSYWVYLMASHSRTLYVGVTRDLARRTGEHRAGQVPGFTRAYRVGRLVYYEEYREIRDALRREKQLKAWRREKKVALVERRNPGWADLAAR